MCGRFTQTHSAHELAAAFSLTTAPAALAPRYNIAPSQPVAVVRTGSAGRELAELRWGLVPAWMREPPADARMINARAETLAQKPSFRAAFRRQRCLIPADGFYEWRAANGRKQPYYIRFPDRRLFAFAGLWERWSRGEPAIESCTIITTDANETLRPLHDRMPVILAPEDYPDWLGEQDTGDAAMRALLRPWHGAPMFAEAVGRHVNDPRHDDAACIEPLPQHSPGAP